MRRWHDETALMFKRWKKEMAHHRYDWRCPPTDPKACHCAKGIGSQRKTRKANGCRCAYCLGYPTRSRQNERFKALRYEEEA